MDTSLTDRLVKVTHSSSVHPRTISVSLSLSLFDNRWSKEIPSADSRHWATVRDAHPVAQWAPEPSRQLPSHLHRPGTNWLNAELPKWLENDSAAPVIQAGPFQKSIFTFSHFLHSHLPTWPAMPTAARFGGFKILFISYACHGDANNTFYHLYIWVLPWYFYVTD